MPQGGKKFCPPLNTAAKKNPAEAGLVDGERLGYAAFFMTADSLDPNIDMRFTAS